MLVVIRLIVRGVTLSRAKDKTLENPLFGLMAEVSTMLTGTAAHRKELLLGSVPFSVFC